MKHLPSLVVAVVMGLVLLAAITPMLLCLATTLIPLVLVVGIAVVVVRLVWFYTARW